jgi:hypothetical protein
MYLALRRSCMNQLSSELRVSGVLGSISNNKTHGFVFQARQTRDIPGMITSLPVVACAARARCLESCDFDTAQRRLLRPASHLADLIEARHQLIRLDSRLFPRSAVIHDAPYAADYTSHHTLWAEVEQSQE